MVRSYAELAAINHLGGTQLPSKAAVAAITEDLLHLLFPGFYDGDNLEGKELGPAITSLLRSVEKALTKEIGKSMPATGFAGETAAGNVEAFLKRLPAVRKIL